MNEQLMSIPSDSLIEMLYVILTKPFAPSVYDGTEIAQIQRELRRRGEDRNWIFATVN